MTCQRIHAIVLPLVFPYGISPGAGGEYNVLAIARDGQNRPVLRGTALAGALRHAWEQYLHAGKPDTDKEAVKKEVEAYFGMSAAEEEHQPSPLRVPDSPLDLGKNATPTIRTYHFRNRHTGAVGDGGLFSIEVCPPQTKTTAVLWLYETDTMPAKPTHNPEEFLACLAGFFKYGLPLGGRSARGIGIAELAGEPKYVCYDLGNLEQHAAWLDADRAWRDGATPPQGEPLPPAETSPCDLVVNFTLVIPRGQDILIGDGQGLDYEIEPQRVTAADGNDYWRLPGASLRGLFRSWVSRLAAREGKPVADNVERHLEREKKNVESGRYKPEHVLRSDDVGWCFADKSKRHHRGIDVTCPVAKLFGSLYEAGRIHISDAYVLIPANPSDEIEQKRMHVAVDRITGGAAEGMLFDNTVLTSASDDGASPEFHVTMKVRNARDDEARWLAETLRALDLGILRVGSSKSAGRLKLADKPHAQGRGSEHFQNINPSADVPVWFQQ